MEAKNSKNEEIGSATATWCVNCGSPIKTGSHSSHTSFLFKATRSHIQNFYGFFWFFMAKLTNCRLVVFQVLRYKTVYRGSWRLNTKVAAIIGWNVSNFWRKCGKLLPSVLVFSATWGPVAMWSKNRSRVSSSENGEIRYGPLSPWITAYFWITAFKREQGTLKITPKWITVSRLTYFLKFGNLWSTRINAVRFSQINFFKLPPKHKERFSPRGPFAISNVFRSPITPHLKFIASSLPHYRRCL